MTIFTSILFDSKIIIVLSQTSTFANLKTTIFDALLIAYSISPHFSILMKDNENAYWKSTLTLLIAYKVASFIFSTFKFHQNCFLSLWPFISYGKSVIIVLILILIILLMIFCIFIGEFRTIIEEIRAGERINHFVSLFRYFKG